MARPINRGQPQFHVLCPIHGSGAKRHGVGDCDGCRAYKRSCRQRERDLRLVREGRRSSVQETRAASGRSSEITFKSKLCGRARKRGRETGLGGTITRHDLVWPMFCPALGTKLDYSLEKRNHLSAAVIPSLDRWDNEIGYFPGNVYVISLRANQIKNNASADELEAIARYARNKPE